MATGTLAIVGSIAGVSIQKTITETGDHPQAYGDANTDIALAAGKAVSSWVKTDANTAAGNLAGGHGYSSGKVDVYWDGGMRYDVDMTVTVNAIALDGGSGDDFPASADTTVVVCTHQRINTAIDGDNVKLLVANSTKHAHLHFEDSGGGVIRDQELVADNPWTYAASSGDASPLTGNPVTVCFATNGTTAAGVLTILTLEDSTP